MALGAGGEGLGKALRGEQRRSGKPSWRPERPSGFRDDWCLGPGFHADLEWRIRPRCHRGRERVLQYPAR